MRPSLARPAAWALAAGLVACIAPAIRPLPAEQLDPLVTRAEEARGLSFMTPVAGWAVIPERLEGLLAEELALAQGASSQELGALEAALGLVPPDTDLGGALLEFQREAVAGFYTPLRRRLYLVAGRPGAGMPPGGAGILVHELVHALQDEHTPLLEVGLGLDDDDDLAFALGALLEGDALRATFRDQELEAAILPTPAEAYAADFDLEWAHKEGSGDPTPRWLRESFLLQYPAGYALVEQVVRERSFEGLDTALADPPLSSEEVLHPERYLDPARRRALAIPSLRDQPLSPGPGCIPVAVNSFGELGLRVWARERGASEERAAEVADGWDGDRAILLRCAGASLVAWLIQLDTARDADELQALAFLPGDPPLRADRRGLRVLLSAGLDDVGRLAALDAPAPRYATLADLLEARPDILARARTRRAAARGR